MRLNFSYMPEDTITEGIRRLGEVVADMLETYRALNPGGN
jgi:DNA-binding transcriptional MocR family regulator